MSQLYTQAADVLQKSLTRRVSLKTAVFGDVSSHKPAVFALVSQTLRYKSVLDEVLEIVPNNGVALKKIKREIRYVMLFDFLFGLGLKGGGQARKIIEANGSALRAAKARLKIRKKVMKDEELLPIECRCTVQLPRYVRVNTIKVTVEEAIATFRKEGVTFIEGKMAGSPDRGHFYRDSIITDVLVFPPGSDFHEHPLLLNGSLVLQDKASCFPPYALAPPSGAVALDACAAPGNKTSALAAVMGNRGKIFAFDKSRMRISHLREAMSRFGASVVQGIEADFLQVDPHDKKYSKVEYAICDPSCSGSGMVDRLDDLLNSFGKEDEVVPAAPAPNGGGGGGGGGRKKKRRKQEHKHGSDGGTGGGGAGGTGGGGAGRGGDGGTDNNASREVEASLPSSAGQEAEERLQQLAEFQRDVVLHAMKFPNMKRVSYSTCSIHQQENEDVVEAILQANTSFRLVPCLPAWQRRGLDVFEGAEHCVRSLPEDGTIGFFLACFERVGTNGASSATSAPPSPPSSSSSSLSSSSGWGGESKASKKRKRRKMSKLRKEIESEPAAEANR